MTRDEMKAKAEEMGLEFKGNISNDALAELIGLSDENTEDVDLAKLEAEAEAKIAPTATKKPNDARSIERTKAEARKEATKLVRAIVTPMDKDKAELAGEIFSCGNSMTGMIKKFIPFGKEWHIPKIIVDTILEKTLWTTRDRRTSKGIVKDDIEIKAYSVNILPDLTQEELNRIVKENK